MSRTHAYFLAATLVATSGLATAARALVVQPSPATPSRSRVALTHDLPRLDGTKLVATMVEVTYEPGGANPAHRHPCPVVGYLLEGHLRMQLEGQPARVLGPGETFYESPDDVHVVSANASEDTRVRFLAYFVCDHATPFSVPVPANGGR